LILEGPSQDISFIDWHKKGNVIVCGSIDGSAWLFNAETGDVLQTFYGHKQEVSCGGFTPNGKRVITGSHDKSLKVWFPGSGKVEFTIEGYNFHTDKIIRVAFHKKKKIVVAGGL